MGMRCEKSGLLRARTLMILGRNMSKNADGLTKMH
jgi:hypothetical protein